MHFDRSTLTHLMDTLLGKHSINLILVIGILMVLGCVCGGSPDRSRTNVSDPGPANVTPTPLNETDSFKALTPAQHLDEAKRIAKSSPSSSQIDEGLLHLRAIPSTPGEYKEAQVVTKQLQKLADAEAAKKDIEENPLKVLKATWRRGAFGAAGIWNVTFQNRSDRPVGDIKYRTRYYSETDNEVGGTGGFFGDGVIQKVIPAKQKRTIQFNDGFISKEAASGSFEMTGWRFVD